MTILGLISDTHNQLRPEALKKLAGVSHIIHAGDICDAAVLKRLRTIAPVTAVRGNNDFGKWASDLPEQTTIDWNGLRIRVVHDRNDLVLTENEAVDIVVYGHSHKPLAEMENGVLFVNPGSAGPRRFSLPISLALLTKDASGPQVRFETLV